MACSARSEIALGAWAEEVEVVAADPEPPDESSDDPEQAAATSSDRDDEHRGEIASFHGGGP